MYFVAYHVMRWRRDDCERDVGNAFPDKSASERAVIVRRSYRNLADTLVEAFWGFGASAAAIKRRVSPRPRSLRGTKKQTSDQMVSPGFASGPPSLR